MAKPIDATSPPAVRDGPPCEPREIPAPAKRRAPKVARSTKGRRAATTATDRYEPTSSSPASRPAPSRPAPAAARPRTSSGVSLASPPQSLPPADPARIGAALREIRSLLDESGVFGDVTHQELRRIHDLLRGLNAAETRAVFDGLTDGELATWTREIDSGAPLGAGGLAATEKHELLQTLARRLTGAELARLAAAFGDHDDILLIGRTVAEVGPEDTKVGFVRALAAETDRGVSLRLETSLGLATTIKEDPQAVAVGEVLASLRGQPAAFDRAIEALTPAQLEAVAASAAGETTRTAAMGGGGVTSVDYRPDRLVRLLDAAAASNDPAVKAKVFRAAARQLEAIRGAGSLIVPYVDRRNDARQVVDAMTRLLRSDTNGIVRQLETQLDRDGRSLIPYTSEMIAQRRTSELGEILLDLQLGNDRRGNAIQRFEATLPGTTGSPHYVNAETLGYVVGAVQVGIAATMSDVREQAAILKSIFGTVAGFVGMAGTVGSIGSTVANGLIGPIVDEICKSVESGYKDLRSAIRELAYPRDARGRLYEGPAEDSYDATVGRVIDAHGNN